MFSYFKQILSSVLMLLGLTGLIDGTVEWVGFLGDIVVVYQNVRDHIFGWLPFEIPNLAKDYLLVGAVIASNYHRMSQEVGRDAKAWEYVIVWLVNCLIWPLLLVLFFGAWFLQFFQIPKDEKTKKAFAAAQIFRTSVIATMVIYVGLLFVYSDFLEHFGNT